MKAVLLVLLAMLAAGTAARAEAPAVLVSIKPLHAIVAGVMDGVGRPDLVVQGAGSEHAWSMRPSDARRLEHADAVFWIGPMLEAFLIKPLEAARPPLAVQVAKLPGLTLLPTRGGGGWEDSHEDGHGHSDGPSHSHAHGNPPGQGDMAIDGHLWLNPENARIIARGVAESLAEIDPARAATYLENAERYGMRLAALDAELRQRLAPVADRPYIVLHDAYQYFEQRFGLAAAGSIAVNPERRPGARRIREMRAKVSDLGARCVFGEPQYRAAIVEVVVDGTGARIGSLDPLGADVPPGGDAYFTMMRDLADSLTRCLGDG